MALIRAIILFHHVQSLLLSLEPFLQPDLTAIVLADLEMFQCSFRAAWSFESHELISNADRDTQQEESAEVRVSLRSFSESPDS